MIVGFASILQAPVKDLTKIDHDHLSIKDKTLIYLDQPAAVFHAKGHIFLFHNRVLNSKSLIIESHRFEVQDLLEAAQRLKSLPLSGFFKEQEHPAIVQSIMDAARTTEIVKTITLRDNTSLEVWFDSSDRLFHIKPNILRYSLMRSELSQAIPTSVAFGKTDLYGRRKIREILRETKY